MTKNQSLRFWTRSDTNQPIHPQKKARILKFWIQVEEELSYLLIAGCDIGVQISVRPSVRQHLRRSLVFSTSVIAASLKPCIVIVLDIPFKHAP